MPYIVGFSRDSAVNIRIIIIIITKKKKKEENSRRLLLTGLVVNDAKRVRVQVAAKLSDNDVRKPSDHVQIFFTVFVEERWCFVGVSLVGTRTHVAHQIHLKTSGGNFFSNPRRIYDEFNIRKKTPSIFDEQAVFFLLLLYIFFFSF